MKELPQRWLNVTLPFLVEPGFAPIAGRWKQTLPHSRSEARHKLNHPASPTPVSDGSNLFVFFSDFGDPFFYPYYYGYYPYGYYPYGYGYDPYGYGYDPYGYGYDPYNRPGYQGVAAGRGSSVAELQRRLARAGYYHGRIDGVMGPRTRYAIRAYERSHNLRVTAR